MRSSLVPHAVLLTNHKMHPHGFTASVKAICKSRPGNLLYMCSAWCFWIVHECAYHIQAKDGFQFLCLNGRFSKHSHMYTTIR